MQEAQVAGCHTAAEADRYLEHKRKIETGETSRRLKHNAQIGPSSQDAPNAFMSPDSVGKDSSIRPAGQGSSCYANDLYIMGFYETQLLSETVSVKSLVCSFSSSTFVSNVCFASLLCSNNRHLIGDRSSFNRVKL